MSCISLHIHQSKDPKISIVANLCGQHNSDEMFESRDQDPPIL